MSKPRVLIVEDEEGFGFILDYFFRRWGWLVTAAPDGPTALDRLDGPPFDLIVLDLMLPGLPGAEVLREVRARRLAVPVAVMTGKTIWDAVKEVEELHPDRLFLKDQFDELRHFAAEVRAKLFEAPP